MVVYEVRDKSSIGELPTTTRQIPIEIFEDEFIREEFMSPDFTDTSYCNICEQIDLKNVV